MRQSCFLLFLLLLAGSASAHPEMQNSLWMLFGAERIQVAVNVSLKEVLITGGLVESESGTYDLGPIGEVAEKHRDYLLAHLEVEAAGRKLAGRVTGVTPPVIFGEAEKSFYQYELEFPLASAPPANVTLRHEMLREFPYAPGESWKLSYLVRVKRTGSEETSTWLLRAGESTTIPTGWPETLERPAAPLPRAAGRSSSMIVWASVGAAVALAAAGASILWKRRSLHP